MELTKNTQHLEDEGRAEAQETRLDNETRRHWRQTATPFQNEAVRHRDLRVPAHQVTSEHGLRQKARLPTFQCTRDVRPILSNVITSGLFNNSKNQNSVALNTQKACPLGPTNMCTKSLCSYASCTLKVIFVAFFFSEAAWSTNVPYL